MRAKFIDEGYQKRIGIGEKTFVFRHPWIPRERSFKPITF